MVWVLNQTIKVWCFWLCNKHNTSFNAWCMWQSTHHITSSQECTLSQIWIGCAIQENHSCVRNILTWANHLSENVPFSSTSLWVNITCPPFPFCLDSYQTARRVIKKIKKSAPCFMITSWLCWRTGREEAWHLFFATRLGAENHINMVLQRIRKKQYTYWELSLLCL